MSYAVISRDPFARQDLVRRQMPARADGCAECGNLNRNGKLWQYGTDPDRIVARTSWHVGVFCSKACHDAHHEV
jgi:hypothetical protein